ncbi:hypothetical protein N7445_006148 [Penicillium cf. griseofulvum]|nr:hypothetical protein N7445_006148 [Penicillium cf. griseofulvum]
MDQTQTGGTPNPIEGAAESGRVGIYGRSSLENPEASGVLETFFLQIRVGAAVYDLISYDRVIRDLIESGLRGRGFRNTLDSIDTEPEVDPLSALRGSDGDNSGSNNSGDGDGGSVAAAAGAAGIVSVPTVVVAGTIAGVAGAAGGDTSGAGPSSPKDNRKGPVQTLVRPVPVPPLLSSCTISSLSFSQPYTGDKPGKDKATGKKRNKDKAIEAATAKALAAAKANTPLKARKKSDKKRTASAAEGTIPPISKKKKKNYSMVKAVPAAVKATPRGGASPG